MSGAEYTASARPAQEQIITEIHRSELRAKSFLDGRGPSVEKVLRKASLDHKVSDKAFRSLSIFLAWGDVSEILKGGAK